MIIQISTGMTSKNKKKIHTLEYYFINKKLCKTYICENCHENFKDIRKYDFHRTMCMKRYCSTCKHTFLSPHTFRKHVSNVCQNNFHVLSVTTHLLINPIETLMKKPSITQFKNHLFVTSVHISA